MSLSSGLLRVAVVAAALGCFGAEAASVTRVLPAAGKAAAVPNRSAATSPMPMLKSAAQIPAALAPTPARVGAKSSVLVVGSTGAGAVAAPVVDVPMGGTSIDTRAFGSLNHPFTTKSAYANGTSLPTQHYPFRATGKLWMLKNGSWSVCTGSLIKKGILVTAAHCVWSYGVPRSGPTQITWEPARHGTALPYGSYQHTAFYVPTVYMNGTDDCAPNAVGVVCANDVAVVVLGKDAAGKFPGERVGWYSYATGNYSYASYAGRMHAQVTQLGYPVAFEAGQKMMRTDSLGYQSANNNVIIGSNQTGGSSGGPWLVNFGMEPATTTSTPSFNAMAVIGTTSWGYNGGTQKEQGASRFGTNSRFPTTPNIVALLNAACAAYPDRC